MSAHSSEVPSFEALMREQEVVQASKFQGRQLQEYNSYLFPGQNWLEPVSSSVTDFLRLYCIGKRVSLEGILKGLSQANPDEPVRMADMGGGRGLALRQLAAHPDLHGHISLTNVDLFDYGLDGLSDHEMAHLENNAPGSTGEDCTPRLIRADAQTVQLPEPMDVITSIETIQYLNDPLASLCNWYNNLADNGLLIIAAGHDWSSWIRSERNEHYTDPDDMPTAQLLRAFEETGVAYAAILESDWKYSRPRLNPSEFKNLVVQKKPGTELIVNAKPVEIWTNVFDYKAAYYPKPESLGIPLIDVIQVE